MATVVIIGSLAINTLHYQWKKNTVESCFKQESNNNTRRQGKAVRSLEGKKKDRANKLATAKEWTQKTMEAHNAAMDVVNNLHEEVLEIVAHILQIVYPQ